MRGVYERQNQGSRYSERIRPGRFLYITKPFSTRELIKQVKEPDW